jgi:8-amino-7-oxononanoate synthase
MEDSDAVPLQVGGDRTGGDTRGPAGPPPARGASRSISLRRDLETLPTAPGTPPERRRRSDAWLDRWLDSCSDLARLRATNPMLDAVIDEVDGRRIRIGDRWLCDFASCNYLGFDLEPEIMASILEPVLRWGTHPSWSRLLGSPVLYEQIETELTELLGAPDTLLLPTITHIHMSVIPVLAGGGTIFLDRRAHKTIYDGTKIATSNGARVQRYDHDDLGHLEHLLQGAPGGSRLICMDGVNSMTGNAPDLRAFAELARHHDALLYVDDAHGFGVIGERTPDEPCDWGSRGNSIVRHFGESYDNVVLVGGFSKAYSSLLAFIALPTRVKNVLKIAAPPYLYSGPSPVASLATVLAGMAVNSDRGDQIRGDLHAKTRRVLDRIDELGLATPNTSGFPIVEIPVGDPDRIDEVGQFLFDRGIYVTLAAFPLVPRHEVGFRIQVTAANTHEEIDQLLAVLEEAADRFRLVAPSGGPLPAAATAG